jgi:cytochrome bd-type quinol oxidase subunit 2
MFFAMLYSNRTGLEALDSKGNAKRYMYWSIALFFIGGLILGPIVQKYAFGSFWEGIPFGYDLTDNKTLIAMLGWIIAWIMNRKQNDKRGWMILASVLMLAVYLIPHSVLGSEIDYTQSQP